MTARVYSRCGTASSRWKVSFNGLNFFASAGVRFIPRSTIPFLSAWMRARHSAAVSS
jgi:hypothetical protein